LQDLQSYTRSLVTEEMNLGNLIEKAIKEIQIEKEKEAETEADAANDEELFEAELFADTIDSTLTDKDFEELKLFEEE